MATSKSHSLKEFYGIGDNDTPAKPAISKPSLDEWTTTKPLDALLKASNELMDSMLIYLNLHM